LHKAVPSIMMGQLFYRPLKLYAPVCIAFRGCYNTTNKVINTIG